MINDNAQKLLLEEYDKDNNYRKILRKANKRKKSTTKLFLYKIIPCGACLALCVVFYQNKISHSPNIELSQVPTNNIELADLNTNATENLNETIDIKANENTTEIINSMQNNITSTISQENNNKDTNKKNTESTASPNTQVLNNNAYKKINCGQASWRADPSISSNLINETASVVKVKVLSVGEAEILPKQDNFYDPYRAYTPVEMQVLENMKGNQLPTKITAYLIGGKIKISNLEKSISNEQAQNLGIINLSKEEKESNYIQYYTDYDYDVKAGNEYIIIIKKVNDNLYRIGDNGYCIFNANTKKNVITNKELVY